MALRAFVGFSSVPLTAAVPLVGIADRHPHLLPSTETALLSSWVIHSFCYIAAMVQISESLKRMPWQEKLTGRGGAMLDCFVAKCEPHQPQKMHKYPKQQPQSSKQLLKTDLLNVKQIIPC